MELESLVIPLVLNTAGILGVGAIDLASYSPCTTLGNQNAGMARKSDAFNSLGSICIDVCRPRRGVVNELRQGVHRELFWLI